MSSTPNVPKPWKERKITLFWGLIEPDNISKLFSKPFIISSEIKSNGSLKE